MNTLDATSSFRPGVSLLSLFAVGLCISTSACIDDGTASMTETEGMMSDAGGMTGTSTTTGMASGTGTGTGTSATTGDSTGGTGGPEGYPQLSDRCAGRVAHPQRLAVTTTDRATGALSWIDVATGTAHNDVAMTQTDTALAQDGQHLYVLNGFGYDFVQVHENQNLGAVSSFKIDHPLDVSSNPTSMAFNGLGQAYIALYGGNMVQSWNLSDPRNPVQTGQFDLSGFADADGIPELTMAINCGNTLFVGAERLNRDDGWAPVDRQYLIPINNADGQLFDFIGNDGIPDAIALLGRGMHGYVHDPAAPSGQQLLVLSSGLERVDLATGTVSWAMHEDLFKAQGFDRFSLADFDIAADGNTLFFSAANADWSSHNLWRATLSSGGADLTQVFSGLTTSTGSLRISGQTLFFADNTATGIAGVRAFDISSGYPVELAHSPIDTGLPPYRILGY